MNTTQNNNTTLMPMNTLSNAELLKTLNTDKEDLEEDETLNNIIKRVITSKITNPANELQVTQVNELLYMIIRFDAAFSSEKVNYYWTIYHTPKEVRKHLKNIYQKIATRELNTNFPIPPIIIQIKNDNEVVQNLQTITDFYNKCFADPNIQNNPLLTNFFNIGGTSFLIVENVLCFYVPVVNYVFLVDLIKDGSY